MFEVGVTKQHGHELTPAGKTPRMALGPMVSYGTLNLVAGEQLQHLTGNTGYSYHGGVGPLMARVFSTQTVADAYRRRSNANLDKSDVSYVPNPVPLTAG
jgi:hypothetical protein